MITSVRYQPVHHNSYMKIYALLEEPACRSRSTPATTGANSRWR